jgi:hypothetical protein
MINPPSHYSLTSTNVVVQRVGRFAIFGNGREFDSERESLEPAAIETGARKLYREECETLEDLRTSLTAISKSPWGWESEAGQFALACEGIGGYVKHLLSVFRCAGGRNDRRAFNNARLEFASDDQGVDCTAASCEPRELDAATFLELAIRDLNSGAVPQGRNLARLLVFMRALALAKDVGDAADDEREEDQEEGALTMAHFLKEVGIGRSTYFEWRKKLVEHLRAFAMRLDFDMEGRSP